MRSSVAARAPPVFNPDNAPAASAGVEYVPRRAKITERELDVHGYTPGCPGCIVANSEKCRQRIEQLIKDQDPERMERAKERIEARKEERDQNMEAQEGDRQSKHVCPKCGERKGYVKIITNSDGSNGKYA